jgi:hypothetical protein
MAPADEICMCPFETETHVCMCVRPKQQAGDRCALCLAGQHSMDPREAVEAALAKDDFNG